MRRDLAEASETGLVTVDEVRTILRSTARLIRLVETGEFPPAGVTRARAALRKGVAGVG